MEPVFKRGDNAKIAPAASKTPEELRVLAVIDGQERAVRRDDIRGQEVVAAQAILAAEPALAPPERQPRDARGGDHAPWRRQAKGRSLPVEIAPRDPALGMDRLAQGIDAQAFHRTEVDDEAALAEAMTGRIVTATAHGHAHMVLPGKVDCGDYIGRASAAHDQRRPLVYHRIVDLPSCVIAVIARTEQGATQARLELLHGGFLKDHLLACGCHDA